MENSAALSHNLRRFRDEHGLSQAELAERAGISTSLFKAADQALYASKQAGRNRVTVAAADKVHAA